MQTRRLRKWGGGDCTPLSHSLGMAFPSSTAHPAVDDSAQRTCLSAEARPCLSQIKPLPRHFECLISTRLCEACPSQFSIISAGIFDCRPVLHHSDPREPHFFVGLSAILCFAARQPVGQSRPPRAAWHIIEIVNARIIATAPRWRSRPFRAVLSDQKAVTAAASSNVH